MLIDDYQFCAKINRAFFKHLHLSFFFSLHLFSLYNFYCLLIHWTGESVQKIKRTQLKRSVSLVLLFQSFVYASSKSRAEPFVYPSREYINGKLYLWTRLKWKWMFSCFVHCYGHWDWCLLHVSPGQNIITMFGFDYLEHFQIFSFWK